MLHSSLTLQKTVRYVMRKGAPLHGAVRALVYFEV
jgi:hypothetical protein